MINWKNLTLHALVSLISLTSLLVLSIFKEVLTKPYVSESRPLPVDGMSVMQLSVVNPGPANIEDLLLEVDVGPEYSNAIEFGVTPGIDITRPKDEGLHVTRRFRFSSNRAGASPLDAGESFSVQIIMPKAGTGTLGYTLITNGRRISSSDAPSRTGFLIKMYNAALGVLACFGLIMILANYVSGRRPPSDDELAVGKAQQSADDAVASIEKITARPEV